MRSNMVQAGGRSGYDRRKRAGRLGSACGSPILVMLALAAVLVLTGCPDPTDPDPTDTAVTGVTLDKTTLGVDVGGTGQLTATVAPADATDDSVSWSSSAAAIASVGSTGLVTGVAAGSAVITVTTTDGGFTDECEVTVTEPEPEDVAVTGVTLDADSAIITLIRTSQLGAVVSPSNATNQAVSWESSDPDVATVGQDGLVTSVAAGTATITVTTTDGGYEDSCAVTVREPDVYIGGSYDEGSYCVPGYWKNGVWNGLTPAVSGRQAEVRRIAVQDGVVYAGGYCHNATDNSIPGYWIDGTWTPLSSAAEGRDGSVESIVVSGTDIYAAGTVRHATESYDLGALWQNGDLTTYALGTDSICIYDLAISGSDTYVAGYGYTGSLYYAGYWKNGTWSPLDPLVDGYEACAIGIAISGTTVIAAGYSYYGGPNNAPRSVAWTDGTIAALDAVRPYESQVNDLLVSDGTVYAAGFYNIDEDSPDLGNYPCYWVDGELTMLDKPEISGMLMLNPQTGTWIAVSGSLAFAASAIKNENEPFGTFPYVWRNGVRTELEIQSGDGVNHYTYGVALE